MKRRTFLRAASASFLAVSFYPHLSFAWPTAFNEKNLKNSMIEYFGSDDYEIGELNFTAPEIAENGLVVPISVSYEGSAEKIAVFVEENPQPLAAAFNFSPKSVARVSTRIKMRDSSRVYVVVKTADGRLIGASKEVKVTIGGCGG